MTKILFRTALLLNACQSASAMNHDNMKSDTMMAQQKMTDNDMGIMKKDNMMPK